MRLFALAISLSLSCRPDPPPVADSMEHPPRVAEHTPPQVRLQADLSVLPADGLSSTTLQIEVYGYDGVVAPDGTTLSLFSTLGQVSDIRPTENGHTTARFTSGTWPGDVEFEAPGWILDASPLALVQGDPYSAQLHLHGSFSEGNGTMLGHTLQAENLGVNVLWWTDHDHYYLKNHNLETTGFDFESGDLTTALPTWPPGRTVSMTWEESSNSTTRSVATVSTLAAHSGTYGLRLGLIPDDPGQRSFELTVHPALNIHPLLAGVDFGFSLKPRRAANTEAELRVGVELSRPPIGSAGEGSTNRIIFYYSSLEHTNTANTIWVPIDAPSGEWTTLSWDLTALAQQYFPDLGADQHVEFASIAFSGGDEGASWDLDDFTWTQRSNGDDLRALQREYLASLPNSPTQHVGYEFGFLSEATHVNAFGPDVTLPDISAFAAVDWPTAVQNIHDEGGIASYNHMFGWETVAADEATRAALVADRTETLLANDAWGCDLLEVGYRTRRGLIQDFLAVWDQLSMAGIYMTGVGVSDLHLELDWGDYVNNFVTWIPAASDSQEDLIHSLKRGLAFFGDPALFPNAQVDLRFYAPDSRATMGQVVIDAYWPQTLELELAPLRAGWEVRLVVDGELEQSWTVAADGPSTFEASIDPRGNRVARFEVWDDAGSPVLFTNPIWFLDDMPQDPPLERLPSP